MRHLFGMVLLLIALAGLFLGVLALVAIPSLGGAAVAYPLLLVGTVALAGITVAVYIEAASDRVLTEMREQLRSQIRTELLLKGLTVRSETQLTELAKIGERK